MTFFEMDNGKIRVNMTFITFFTVFTGMVAGYTTAISAYFTVINDLTLLKSMIMAETEARQKEMGWIKNSVTRIENSLDNSGFNSKKGAPND